MGTKNLKGAVSIEVIKSRIRLRWRFNKQRFSINLSYYSKHNLLKAKSLSLQIETDIYSGCFDSSLQKYKNPIPADKPQEIKPSKNLIEYFEEWVMNYRNMSCDRDIDYYSIRSMMRKWENLNVSTVLTNLNKESIAPSTYNRRLTMLSSFFAWCFRKGITKENPFIEVIPKKSVKKYSENRKPFSEKEIKSILDAFKNNSFGHKLFPHSHYYPFIYFMLKTGVRNAEAVGLRKKSIDLNNRHIKIHEVLARTIKGSNPSARIRKGTKNGKVRCLPLTKDLECILLPLIRNKKLDDLVFVSHKGFAIDDNMFQKRIFKKVLLKLNIKPRALYACRHTFSSRCIHLGISPVATAFLLGNNPQTALRNYTHQLEVPKDLPGIL
jgi:integrase